MIGYIIIALFLILIAWILFGPVILSVNTARNRYQVSLPGVISAFVIPENGLFYIRAWVLFIPIRINPLAMERKKKPKSGRKSVHLIRSARNRKSAGRATRMLRAIRIRKLKLNIDADDVILNAWLVPVFSAANQFRNIEMQVNFEGHLMLDMDIRTRLGALIWMMLKR